MSKFANSSGVGLSVAVWLAHDDYDYVVDPNYISVTTLMKPVKQIVLAKRLPDPATMPTPDVLQMYASRRGSAIHDSIERVWINNYDSSLKSLGIKKVIRDMIRINPTDEEVLGYEEDGVEIIPVYMEQREQKEVHGFIVGGKYDLILEGYLEDYKTTSTYTYTHGTNDEKHKLQGSLYRWLNPKKVTQDIMKIQYLFTDWNRMESLRNPDYPAEAVLEKRHQLHSYAETNNYVNDKLIMIKQLDSKPENEMPDCTDEDLWREKDVFKYFADPAKVVNGVPLKGTRATKNFTTKLEADAHRRTKGKGIVVTVKGKVKACIYCDVAVICQQKDVYLANGSLVL